MNCAAYCLCGQSGFDIRFLENGFDSLANSICYDVQLRSSGEENWHLAGQNYRLYYDASKLVFESGVSLLGLDYQSFNLIQNVQGVDASSLNGCLNFEPTLGFLNYTVDLLNPAKAGVRLPSGGSWLSANRLCFKIKLEAISDSLSTFELVWARSDLTMTYATSFVEVSEWLDVNQTTPAEGHRYFDMGTACRILEEAGVFLKTKVFLQGSYDDTTGLMRDVLRQKNYLPLQEPYTNAAPAFQHTRGGKEQVDAAVFRISGENAIVDWVFLELRDKTDASKISATRAALLQRDGDVVEIDGFSPVQFSLVPDSYYVAIRHRNHLGIMSKFPVSLRAESDQIELFDYTDPDVEVYGNQARKRLGNVSVLWGGNADNDGFLVFRGGGIAYPDGDQVFFDVFTDPKNHSSHINHIVDGYHISDTNMDGMVKYQGPNNDLTMIFYNIIQHPNNIYFNENFYINGQLPKL